MKRFTLAVAAVMTLALLAAPLTAPPVRAADLQWQTYSKGLELGKQLNKNVYINFYADWCTYCAKMDKETLADPDVVAYLNEHFVVVKVNSDKAQDLSAAYQVQGLPTSWFLSAAGEKIAPIPGFVPANMFLPVLKYVQSESYKTMKFKEFVDKGLDRQ